MFKQFTFPVFLLAAFTLFVAGDCNREDDDLPELETGTLEVTYKAVFAGETFSTGAQTYDYDGSGSTTVRFDKFDFFVHEVNASGSGTEDNELDEVDFFDFTFLDAEAAANGFTRIYSNVPVGNYSGFNLKVGVPSDENDRFCTECADTHPLSRESHWWPAWESYIFQKLEGKADTNGDGVTDDVIFSYHTGTDAAARSVNLMTDFAVNGGETTRLTILFDVQQLFVRGSDFYTLDTGTHSDSDAAMAMIKGFMDQYPSAFSVAE